MHYIGIIPARYASSRFPGKPMVDMGGKTMIQRVYEQASKAIESVYVATDDDRIANHVADFGGKVVMTSSHHQSGTDRCAEAIKKVQAIEENSKYDVVINIQGDEPFIKPEQLRLVMSCFDDEKVHIATLSKIIEKNEDLFNPNVVKVIRNRELQAIYFSRSPVPFIRNKEQGQWAQSFQFLKHLGLYAYRTSVLKEITLLQPSSLELAESLEQNRWIENGYSILVETTTLESISIDTPEDLEKALKMIK